ncbi:MAG: acyl carrier protein [Bacteroidetes bacterium]|nr:acyl carrier protein [Bacteroidota bacterium]
MDTFEQLNAIFCKVFDDNDIKINKETTSNDIDGWDSLSHVNLVVSIEKGFGVRFKNAEILRWKNVGQMFETIEEKLAEKTNKA